MARKTSRLHSSRRTPRLDFAAIEIVGALLTPDIVARIASLKRSIRMRIAIAFRQALKTATRSRGIFALARHFGTASPPPRPIILVLQSTLCSIFYGNALALRQSARSTRYEKANANSQSAMPPLAAERQLSLLRHRLKARVSPAWMKALRSLAMATAGARRRSSCRNT